MSFKELLKREIDSALIQKGGGSLMFKRNKAHKYPMTGARETVKINLKTQIWRFLRNLDVAPVKIPILEAELFEMIIEGNQMIIEAMKHDCCCQTKTLVMSGCHCGGE